MKIGFTGTQRGMTPLQKEKIKELLVKWGCTEFHHGDCVGADATASTLAELAGIRIVCHPPINSYKRAFMPCDEMRVEKDYLVRNHDIVDETDMMLATPGECEEVLRSGTWATIRYARRMKKVVEIVFPG